ncbi:hypothetical protein OY671_008164, partial [Metschnikowia pulcherrima]
PQDVPSASCDARTSARDDSIEADAVFDEEGKPEWSFEGSVVAHNAAHRWHYFPASTRDEAISFKTNDTEEGRAHHVPHVAFDSPDCPPDAPPRVSIEMRATAWWWELFSRQRSLADKRQSKESQPVSFEVRTSLITPHFTSSRPIYPLSGKAASRTVVAFAAAVLSVLARTKCANAAVPPIANRGERRCGIGSMGAFPQTPYFTGSNEPVGQEVELKGSTVEGTSPAEVRGSFFRAVPDPAYPPKFA